MDANRALMPSEGLAVCWVIGLDETDRAAIRGLLASASGDCIRSRWTINSVDWNSFQFFEYEGTAPSPKQLTFTSRWRAAHVFSNRLAGIQKETVPRANGE